MIGAEQEKKHHAAAHDRDGETSVAQAERKENNNRGTHVPERDFTLPAGVPALHRPLGAENRKRGLYDERRNKCRKADDQKDSGKSIQGGPPR